MKLYTKIFATISAILISGSITSFAKTGDVAGTALHTDIVTYINHYALPSYAVNGQSVIVAEDLVHFGFDVTWNNYNRSLTITRNYGAKIKGVPTVDKSNIPGTKFVDVLETDIKVYANNVQLTSYALNGYTLIPLEELNVFGNVYWVESERAVKLWIDGLHALAKRQDVKITPIELVNINGQKASVLPKDYNAYVKAGWYTYSDFIIAYTNKLQKTNGLEQATEYLQNKIKEGGFTVEQKHRNLLNSLYNQLYNKYKVPILIKGTRMNYTYGNTPQVYIDFWNISGKDISSFDLTFYCYNSYGKPDTTYYNGRFDGWMVNAGFKAGTVEDYYWTLYDYPKAVAIKNLKITKVAFADGSVWY